MKVRPLLLDGGGQVGADECAAFAGGAEVADLLVREVGAAAQKLERGAGEAEWFQVGDEGILEVADAHGRVLSLRA